MGRTVIDSLVLELGFNTEGMELGRKKVQDVFKRTRQNFEDDGKKFDEQSKKSQQYLEKLRNNLVSLLGVFTADRGLKNFVQDMTAADASVDRFSKSIGTAYGAVQRLRGAATAFGVDPNGINATLSSIASQMANKQLTGQNGPLIQAMFSLGMDPNTNGRQKTPDEIFNELRERTKPLEDGTAAGTNRRRQLLENAGIDPSVVQMMLSTDTVWKRVIEDGKEWQRVTDADKDKAQERLLAWSEFKQTLAEVGIQFLTVISPALVIVTKGLTALVSLLKTPWVNTVVVGSLIAMLGLLNLAIGRLVFGSALGTLLKAFPLLTTLVRGLATVALPLLAEGLAAVGAAILALPTGVIIAGIVAIGAAAYWLINHWDTVKKWWHEFWGGAADDVENAADRVQGAKKRMSEPQKGVTAPAGVNKQAWDLAVAGQQKFGVPAAVTYAQWQLESASGTRMPAGSNNPFGIKANASQIAAGKFVTAWTNEEVNGQMQRVQQKFAKFDTLEQAFDAHGRLLANGAAYAEARKHQDNAEAYAQALTGHYATDSQYGNKLIQQMRANQARASADTQRAMAQAMQPAPAGVAQGPSAQQVASASSTNSSTVNHNTSDTRIGEMHVHSAATDAAGIAGDIKNKLASSSDDIFMANSNSGPI